MFKNITIGQYYPADSLIHRIDARIKLLAMLVFITMLFMINNFIGYLFCGICLSLVVYSSKVPVSYLIKGLKGIVMIVLFTSILNLFFTAGDDVIFEFFKLKVTLTGLLVAIKMTIRLTFLIISSSLLTLTTSSMSLTDAIEYALKPFKKIGIPSHEIAMMMTIALRFIPTLLEEMDKIMKAQMARGADFDTGGIFKKAKSLIPLFVPLFISAFRRAFDLATAMEARCYRGDINRTRMKVMKFKTLDYKALTCLVLFTTITIVTMLL